MLTLFISRPGSLNTHFTCSYRLTEKIWYVFNILFTTHNQNVIYMGDYMTLQFLLYLSTYCHTCMLPSFADDIIILSLSLCHMWFKTCTSLSPSPLSTTWPLCMNIGSRSDNSTWPWLAERPWEWVCERLVLWMDSWLPAVGSLNMWTCPSKPDTENVEFWKGESWKTSNQWLNESEHIYIISRWRELSGTSRDNINIFTVLAPLNT